MFKQEVKAYGDLRHKLTWEKVFSFFEAKTLWEANDDNQFLIEFYLVQAPREEGYNHLVPQIVQEFVTFPEGLEMLMDGFQQIRDYGCGYGASYKQVSEVLQYVQEATGRLGSARTESRSLPAAV
ncbi:MAG: hypothetical protein ACRC8A_21305 [Microcoleaceae cyanobacterium]